MASSDESNVSSIVLINNDGLFRCCDSLVPEKEIIPCSMCKGRFHATCKTAKSKICNASLLNNFMSGNTRNNFLWFCDPCLTSFHENKSKNDSGRLVDLEKKYDDIATQLEDIKSLCSEKSTSTTLPPVMPLSTNPWRNSTRLQIMRNNLNGETANVVLLEEKISPEINKNIVSTQLKDGSTLLSCASPEDVTAIEEIVKESFPDHTVTLKKPSKSIIRIVGFKSEYTSEQFADQLFSRNPSLSSFNKPEHFDFLSVKPCLKDATTFQAVVKVSLPFRKAILDMKNRLFVSYFKCIVYNQLNVNRCNKCQRFGHYARDCKNNACCAKCNGNHETNSCGHSKESPSKCANCVRANKPTHDHRADDSVCPCYIVEHGKKKQNLMKSLN